MPYKDPEKQREYFRQRNLQLTPKQRERKKRTSQAWRESHPDRMKALGRAWRTANPEQHRTNVRRQRLKRNYGITPEEYDEMLAAQGGHCAICPATEPGGRGAFHVDHDHGTGQGRGLLCHSCNTAIGLLGDDPTRCESASAYLRKWGK